jgi:hypothetical protein
MTVWLHPHLTAEAPDQIDRVVAALHRASAALRSRSGAIKALRGPWPGTLRLRFGGTWRAIFSWSNSPDGQREAWVHVIDRRKQIYERDTAMARVLAWDADRRAAAYRRAPPPNLAVAPPPGEAVLPLLSEAQEGFLHDLLPLQGARSRALLHIAIGPPGSGKSVVAADAAREALASDHDVLIVVPSGKLQRRFRADLAPILAVETTPIASASPPRPGQPRLWVERAPELFAAFGPAERGPSLSSLWPDLLNDPPLQRWRKAHPLVQSPRFVAWMEAAFGDTEALGDRAKDALSGQDRPLRAAAEALAGAPAAFLTEQGLCLRWHRARAARAGLAGLLPNRDLVVLVDEAQDLAPAEWQTLLAATAERRARGWRTALALLGDENQRITPTAFSWNDVKEALYALDPAARRPGGLSITTLASSFRIPRAIAQAAAPLMDGRLDGEGSRRAPLADPDSLPDDGQIFVYVDNNPAAALLQAAEVLRAEGTMGRLVVLIGDNTLQHGLIDALDIEEAKGLEWDRVVLTDLLPTPLDFNIRARAYTRMTRARRHLLLLLRPDELDHLEPFWKVDGLPFQRIQPAALPEALRASLDLGVNSLGEELLERLHNRLDAAEQAGGVFPEAALLLGRRVVEAGYGGALLGTFDDLWARRPDWESALRERLFTDIDPSLDPSKTDPLLRSPQPSTSALAALLLGDAGAAWALARRDGDQPLSALLWSVVEDGGRLHRASAALREEGAAATPLPELARRALHRQIRGHWALDARLDPPTGAPTGPSALARAVAATLEAQVGAYELSLQALGARLREGLDARLPAPPFDEADAMRLSGLLARASALLTRFGPPEP